MKILTQMYYISFPQRREYKSKFLEVETETARLKERLETMNHILDEMQEKMYEFEQNKKNNLIFHGILADHPETPDGYVPNIHGHAYFFRSIQVNFKSC